MRKIKKSNTLLELKTKILNELTNKNFKSLITLTYPKEVYPKEEKSIKNHVSAFNDKIKNLDQKGSYFYISEMQTQSTMIYIHILCTVNDKINLLKLKTYWLKISKTKNLSAFNFKEIDAIDIEKVCYSVLNTIENNEIEKSLQVRLDTKRILGGSIDLQSLLKEIRCKLELPKNFIELNSINKLETMIENLFTTYKEKGIDYELVKTEVIIELNSYNDVLDVIYYQKLENFLLTGKSKISKGYLKFYNFIKEICSNEMDLAKNLLKSWYIKKERKTTLVEKIALILNLNDETQFSANEILFRVCLDYLIKSCLRNLSMWVITYNLGKISCKKVIFEPEPELQEEEYRKIGVAMYLIIKNMFKDKLNFYVVETQETKDLSLELDVVLDNSANMIQIQQKIEFSFNEEWFKQLKSDKRITKNDIAKLVQFYLPMLVEPKDWIISQELSNEYSLTDTKMYDAGQITSGGALLNGYYFNKSLQKNKTDGNAHQLAVSTSCIETINKLQKIPFIVNEEQLNLLNKYKKYIPDHLTTWKRTDFLELRKIKRQRLKELYQKVEQDKKEGKSNEKNFYYIRELRHSLEEIKSTLTKHELFNRVLSGFNELVLYKEFYYSYDLDFRMRLYPQQVELSPQGSKLSRSLIKFKEQAEFNEYEFKLYSARLHSKTFIFKEEDLIFHYNNYVLPLFDKFVNNEDAAVQIIFTEDLSEPYLLLAACIEYKKYKQAEIEGKPYMTGYPIILDCSGSGPQIMSLLFLMETFTQYLNLSPDKDGIRRDFYVSIVSQFLYEYKPVNRITKDKKEILAVNIQEKYLQPNISEEDKIKFLIILRSICKSDIMTQLYGVTYKKFSQQLESGLIKNKEKLKKYVIENINYDTFITDFITEFWYYQRSLPLYKLREFFLILIRLLKDKNGSLQWSTLDVSKININYKKSIKKKIDYKDKILGRLQMNYNSATLETDYTKIRNSAQANFIHSLDAAVNMHILTRFNSSIFPIHDAWGVSLGQSVELRKLVSEIYLKIAENNTVLQKCIEEFVQLLNENVSKTAGDSFKLYCKENIFIGKYDPSVLSECKFMVYY